MPTTDPTTMPPLSTFQSTGKSDVLRASLPEPTFYSGRNYIELTADPTSFSAAATAVTYQLPVIDSQAAAAVALSEITNAMVNGFDSGLQYQGSFYDKYFPSFPSELKGKLRYAPPSSPVPLGDLSATVSVPDASGNPPPAPSPVMYSGVYLLSGGVNRIDQVSTDLQTLTPDEVLAAMYVSPPSVGSRLQIRQDLDGRYTYVFVPVPPAAALIPRLALIEEYRLTTFLGRYGAGRTIKTMSLLPGESSKITIKSYTRTTDMQKDASSVLDSLTESSADDFQNKLESEISDKETSAHSDEWQVDASVTGKFGVGSASLSASYGGSINSAREQAAKNVTNSVRSHAAKASSKRDVRIEQTSDSKTESGDESGVERNIQNINVGRTLNFVFRQMNQELISILHMVDVGVGFANGMPDADQIVPLWKLDSLLAQVIADAPEYDAQGGLIGQDAKRKQVKNFVLRELAYVRDYQGSCTSFYEQYSATTVEAGVTVALDSYIRPRRDLKQTYTQGSLSVDVPGIILAVSTNIMRTDGILVETLLGQSEALDDYSKNIRVAATQAQTVANDALAADLALEQTRQQIVSTKQSAQADAFARMFPVQIPGSTGTTP